MEGNFCCLLPPQLNTNAPAPTAYNSSAMVQIDQYPMVVGYELDEPVNKRVQFDFPYSIYGRQS